MGSHPAFRRYYLLTYPRTASNLLLRILALEDQPSLVEGGKNEYLFAPTMEWRTGQNKTAGKHISEWTGIQISGLKESYQTCFEALQEQLDKATAQQKDVYIKEHVPWLIEPVAETRFLYGDSASYERAWMVETSYGNSRSKFNETIFPDEFLRIWLPTFLIRHPALVFPSNYRTCLDNEGQDIARSEMHALEMTIHWSRTLYDWYTEPPEINLPTTSSLEHWPIILDADDIITQPDIVIKYAEIVGFDITKLKSSWDPSSKQELDAMSAVEKRMKSTLLSSSSIVKEKASADIRIETEMLQWRTEFGDDEAQRMEGWVRAAMPDYEYLRARRLIVH